MFDKLNNLKLRGYVPDAILDIGAYHGHWTNNMKQLYNGSDYYLFEGIDYTELQKFKDDPTVNVYNVILNDKIETVNWYQMKNTGDSMFREKTNYFSHCDVIQRETVDLNTYILQDTQLQTKLQDAKHIFMKIDCQGAEIPIIRGATSLLNKTDFIILELPLFGQYNEGVPNFLEHIAFMDSIGFIPYEMLENHYFSGFNIQVDMLFINKNNPLNTLVQQLLK